MKKLLIITLSLIISICSMALLACGNPEHLEHDYNSLKFNAKAHWYECSCGQKAEQEKHYGGVATETQKAVCEKCNQEYGELSSNHSHNYNTLKYDSNTHWYECVCGEKSNTESHKGGTATQTQKAKCSVCNQEYGSLLIPGHSHNFNKQVATEKHLKSPATCKSPALYFLSCECGENGTNHFESGSIGTHNYISGACEYCGAPEAQTQIGPISKSTWQTVLSTPITNGTLRVGPNNSVKAPEYNIFEYSGNLIHKLPYEYDSLVEEKEIYCQSNGSDYTTYQKSTTTGEWIKTNAVDQTEDIMLVQIMINFGYYFINYYNSFSYIEASSCYVATNLEIGNETYEYVRIYFKNNALEKVEFTNGSLTIKISDIGSTTITLPEVK